MSTLLSYKVHYNKDWNMLPVIFAYGRPRLLSYKVHYNKDWNCITCTSSATFSIAYRTKSITTRIETTTIFQKCWVSPTLIVQSPLQQGLKLSKRRNIGSNDVVLSYKVHYNKDWNVSTLLDIAQWKRLIVQSPLQQGLKRPSNTQLNTPANSYRTKSITTRIETSTTV